MVEQARVAVHGQRWGAPRRRLQAQAKDPTMSSLFTLLGLTSDISNDARMHAPRGLVGAVRQHMLDASDVEKLRERQVAQYNIS